MLAMRVVIGLLIWPLGAWWLTDAAAKAQPDKWTRGNRVSIAALAGILGFFGFLVMAAASAPPQTPTPAPVPTPKPALTPASQVSLVGEPRYTTEARLGAAAEIAFTLRNDGLDAPDGVLVYIPSSFFDGFILRGADPPWSSMGDVPIVGREIIWGAPNPGREITYRLSLVANKAGEYPFRFRIRVANQDLAILQGRAVVLP